LLVVLSIMSIIGFGVIANYAGTRSARNLHIAVNELVTNIRKIQSYTLSSRNLPNGSAPDFYLAKFDTNNAKQYVLEGMYNTKSSPAYIVDIETIPLPQGVFISGTSVGAAAAGCTLAAFQLPFARILANSRCTGGPPQAGIGDDYQKFINFVVNNSASTVSSDVNTIITLKTDTGLTAGVMINGTTGVVCPVAAGGTACLATY